VVLTLVCAVLLTDCLDGEIERRLHAVQTDGCSAAV